MNAKTLMLIAVLGLAGCTTPAQQRQANFDACLHYGFNYGTPEFGSCMQQRELAQWQNQQAEIRWLIAP